MTKNTNLFESKVLNWLKIPEYIRQEFMEEAAQKNDFSMRIICIIIFVIELFNIFRVLFMSASGLSTLNNRIYFSMYCALIAVAVLWLVLQVWLKRATPKIRVIVQCTATGLMLLWHMGLNSYDLYRDPNAGVAVITTALLALALFIQQPPWYCVLQSVVGYVLFWLIMAPRLSGGDRLNMTITFVVAFSVSMTYAHHTSITLKQQKQILQMNARLHELVQLDPLTGLLNKTAVEYRVEQILEGVIQTGKSNGITLFLLDMDEFKKINDSYGHPCGDHVLTETSEAIRRAFSDADMLGRVGGDEFAVIYNHAITEERAYALRQDLVKYMDEITWEDRPVNVGCSVGVTICDMPKCTYHQLYSETDRILYRAKENGRGRCCVEQLSWSENVSSEVVAV